MFRFVTSLVAALMMMAPIADAAQLDTGWQTPPEEVMKVLHAPQLPWVWTSPTGENLPNSGGPWEPQSALPAPV